MVKDPVEKLEEKMQSNKAKFELKPISQSQIRKVLKKWKKRRVQALMV